MNERMKRKEWKKIIIIQKKQYFKSEENNNLDFYGRTANL